MDKHEGQKRAHDETTNDDQGPTEKLRDEDKSEAEILILGEAGVPGVQNAESDEFKEETKPNTE
ncbi:MAG TPA: hypothetical protein DCK93_04095 [Blastocatellia bacterium]|jgi:hypothetical protein|nr:hypothetical protein [Blastocatellia bacterium]HAF22085.1 hypothetical protein [Blastocatellia bacterium]